LLLQNSEKQDLATAKIQMNFLSRVRKLVVTVTSNEACLTVICKIAIITKKIIQNNAIESGSFRVGILGVLKNFWIQKVQTLK
jgi:hypothetical protein